MLTSKQILLLFAVVVQCCLCGKNESFVNTSTKLKETSTILLHVSILHRHGLRSPESAYPTDPYQSQKKFWPEGWGQLLPEGKRQLYTLGTTLRTRYEKFIREYSVDAVKVNTSDLDRCHMSGAALLAGWFPPEGNEVWSNKLLWQPIPIHSIPISLDRTLGLRAPCPKYDLMKKKLLEEISVKASKDDKKLFKYLTKHLGVKITHIEQIELYYATLLIEERNGLKLPKWTRKVYPETMKKLAAKSMSTYTWNHFMKRIYGGPILKDILHQFQLKSENKDKASKLTIYSGSDTAIVDVLRGLQFKKRLLPDFGASVIFELHKALNDNTHYVKLLYMHDADVTEPKELSIPHCKNPCSLAKLLQVTKYVRSVDWDKDCVI